MPTSASDRSTKYGSKIDGDVVRARIEAQKVAMSAKMVETSVTAVADETTVKQVIEPLGVAPHLVVAYLNFGRGVSKIKRTYPNSLADGSTGQKEVESLGTRAVARGLTGTTIEAIALAFGYTIDVTP